jgi:hypothetical protein
MFRSKYRFYQQDEKIQLARDTVSSVLQLLVTANVVRSPLIVSPHDCGDSSSETSVLTRVIQRIIAEDGILHNCLRETSNLT